MLNQLKPALGRVLGDEERGQLRRKQGLPVAGVDIKLIDEAGDELPHDGTAIGEIYVRAPA